MQQIYKRMPMPKCDFNKVALYGCSPVDLLHILRTLFSKNTSWWLLLYLVVVSFSNITCNSNLVIMAPLEIGIYIFLRFRDTLRLNLNTRQFFIFSPARSFTKPWWEDFWELKNVNCPKFSDHAMLVRSTSAAKQSWQCFQVSLLTRSDAKIGLLNFWGNNALHH